MLSFLFLYNRKLYLSTVLFPALYLSAYGQYKLPVVKVYAYYTVISEDGPPRGGTNETVPLQTDSTALPPPKKAMQKKDTQIVVIIETNGQPVEWINAKQGGQLFSVVALPVRPPYNAGFIYGGTRVEIKAAKKNSLFVLQLSKKQLTGNIPSPIEKTPISFSGKTKGKYITFKIIPAKQLEPVPAA